MSENINLRSLDDKPSASNPLTEVDKLESGGFETKGDDELEHGPELSEDVQKAISECSDDVCVIVQQWLTNSPQSVNARDSEEKTALHLAAEQCNSQLADILLKAGADPSLVDDEERTALHCLCQVPSDENIADCADLICSKMTNIDAKDSTGCTALYYVSENGHLEVVIKLLDKGADMAIGNDIEETPVHRAAKSGWHKILAEMVKRNPDCALLANADEETPLHLAAGEGHLEAVKVILGSPSTPNVNARSIFGETPLQLVGRQGSIDVAKLLLKHGSDLNPSIDNESTSVRSPFHNAAYYGRSELALFLLNKGALVTFTAFKDVLTEGYENIARVVIESDQWPIALRGTYKDQQGKTTTPFREMIKKMPALAEKVLNYCVVEDTSHERQDQQYSVLYNYEFLEDCHEDSDPVTQPGLMTASLGKAAHDCSYSDVDAREKYFIPAWGPSKLSDIQHPLLIMVQRKELNLLRHPVVASLLHYKWKKFGLVSYSINLLTYIIFLSFLTAFALLVPNPQSPVCNNNTNGADLYCPGPTNDLGIFLIISSAIVLLMGGSRLMFEAIQLLFQRLSYLTSWVNWVEASQYVCSIIFVFVYITDCFCVLDWQWQIGVAAVFLGWINLILFMSKLPFIGIYVIILIRICITFVNLLFLTLLLIIAFGLTFYMIFFDMNVMRSPFYDIPRSFVKIMTMTTGELDYDAIFRLDPAGESDSLAELKYLPISYILWITFIAVMPVIFNNMLTSLAVGDTAVVQEQAQLEKLAEQVDQVFAIEEILTIFRKCLPKRLRRTRAQVQVFPNSPKRWLRELSFRLWEGERYDHRDVIMKVINPPEVESEEMLRKTDALSDKIKHMSQKLVQFEENMNKKLDQFELLLEEVARKKIIHQGL